MRRILVALGLLLVVSALALAVLTKTGGVDVAQIAHRFRSVAATPHAPLYGVACIFVAAVIGLPFTSMAAVAMLLFDVTAGAICTYVGALLGGSVVYLIGRFAARDSIERWLSNRSDSRLGRFNARLGRHGFIAVALIRLTPIPFVVQNVFLGASRVRYVDFLAGSAVGVLPVLVLVAVLTEGVDVWVDGGHPSPAAIAAGVSIALFAVTVIVLTRRRAMNRQDQ